MFNHEKIYWLKEHVQPLSNQRLGKTKIFPWYHYFREQSRNGITISQSKYALDILKETNMLDCRPIDSPMDRDHNLLPSQGEPYSDPERYRRLVLKLIYLTNTRPNLFIFL